MPFLSPSRAALALLFFAVGVSSSHALQLGESEAQIVARHGAPAVADHSRRLAMYYWTGWSARLEFHGGVVGKLIYKKTDYLGPADITSLLQANGGANRWRENTPVDADTRQWLRDDGAVASCDAMHATAMTFQSGQVAASAIQQLGSDPKAAAAPAVNPVPATPPPAPQFFPDPLAAPLKPDPKLSEISVPAASPEPSRPPAVPIAPAPPASRAVPPSQPRAPATPSLRASVSAPDGRTADRLPASIEVPASIDPPTQTEPSPGPAAVSPEPPREEPAPAAPHPDDGFGRIAALGCLIFGVTGALILLYKSLPRRPRHSTPTGVASPGVVFAPSKGPGLDALRWEQVELLVGEIHRRAGYTAELSAGLGAENGIDLTLRRNTETVLVQCKHWKTFRVTEREMREFYGAMASSGSPLGIFVTMGGVTRGAREFAEEKGIDLIDRGTLEQRMAGIAHPGENMCVISEWIEDFAAHSRIFDPECPLCREPMTLRSHPAGHSAFWGCRNYPRCSGKREPRRDLLDLISARQGSSATPAV